MTTGNFNDYIVTPEFPEEKPVNVSPTSIEEIRARKGRATPEPTQEAQVPQTSANQLSDRVAQLEAALGRERVSRQDLEELIVQVKDLTDKMNSLMSSLQGTVGFGARHSFVCRSCQSKGQVAARLHCTSCGEENWWGWWPRKGS